MTEPEGRGASPLEIRIQESGSIVTVAFEGELDISRAEQVERELQRLEATGPQTLAIDLRKLDFLDSTGLRILLAADSRARKEGRRVVIVRGPEPVERVFRITLLDRRLQLVDEPPQPTGEEAP